MNIYIEYQDISGNWRPFATTQNVPAIIRQRMNEASRFHNTRIRAIDDFGRIVDIL